MRIGEVARRSGVSARMLRHYESIGLLEPSERTSAGYREYSDADIGRIFHIEGLRRLGMSLAEVREVLDDPSFDTTRLLGDLIAKTRERIDAEERLLAHLERTDRLGRTDPEALLWTIDLMRSLESADVIQRHKAALGGGIDGSVPIEALSSAVLDEPAPNAAGAMRWALAQAGSAAVSPLLTGVDDPSAAVRIRAIRALDEIRRTTGREELGEEAVEEIRDALRSRLDDEDDEVRGLCAFALAGLDDTAAIPELLTIAMNGPQTSTPPRRSPDSSSPARRLFPYHGRAAPGCPVIGRTSVSVPCRSSSRSPMNRSARSSRTMTWRSRIGSR